MSIIAKCLKCRKEYELRYCNNRLCLTCKVLNKKDINNKTNKRISLIKKSAMVSCRFCKKLTSGYHGKRYCSNSCRTMFNNIPKKIIWAENEILILQEKIEVWESIKNII